MGFDDRHAEADARRLSVSLTGRVILVIVGMVCAAVVLWLTAVAAAPARTSPAGSARFAPQSFSAIDDSDWWVLGTRPCGRGRCVAIEHTTDGGARFVAIPTPPIGAQGGLGPGLAFADQRDGFAWGKTLWVTRNGGHSWARVARLGDVDKLVVAAGFVYALTYRPRGYAPDRLWRRAIRGGPWTRLGTSSYTPEAGGPLAAHGTTIILAASSPVDSEVLDHYALVSSDRGAHFSAYRLHTDSDGCSGFDVTSARVIWTYCVPPIGPGQLRRSVNAGRTFTNIGPPGGQTSAQGVFAAASDTTAIVADTGEPTSPRKRPYLTFDAGRHYIAAGPANLYWRWFDFIDATHGVALANHSGSDPFTLFMTTNGGRSYQPVRFRG